MAWEVHRVVFRVKTPIHIGYRKYGNLMQTRPYVPARVLLGALTFKITREIFGQTKDWKHYRMVGEVLNRVLASSYFYPTTDEAGRIDKFPFEEDFPAYKFIWSYVSTALENESGAAQEGSLHEVEYISPHTMDDGEKIYLSGYIFVKNVTQSGDITGVIEKNLHNAKRNGNLSENEVEALIKLVHNMIENGKLDEILQRIRNWRVFVKTLQIGGERGYGWGKVELHRTSSQNSNIFGIYGIDLRGERPKITVQTDKSIPAHVLIADVDGGLPIVGQVEPLVRREWRKGPGSKIVFDGVAYKPGAITKSTVRVYIDTLGYLKPENSP